MVLTPLLLCVLILYMSYRTYSFLKSTRKDSILKKLLMTILFIFRVFAEKSAERKSLKKYFFILPCVGDIGPGV